MVVLLRCVILLLIKDFPHKSGCAKGDLIAAPSLSPFCAVKHTNRQALLSVTVTVHGFPVPSSPCLVCVRVRMCEQVSVGVCD